MKTPKWNYTGDVNMLDYGGKNWRCVGNRQFQFIELINMDEACGRDNAGQPKYNVGLRMVDLNTASVENVKSALDCCGQNAGSGLADDIIAECLDSYGCRAPLEQYSGNNARQLMREAYQAANALLNPDQLARAMDKPVNQIGSTAREFMTGDFTSAIQRGCEAGSPDARIMAKIHGATQQAIDDARSDYFLPYLMGYMCALNGGARETGKGLAKEYHQGFERGQNVRAGKCPAPSWIKQQ